MFERFSGNARQAVVLAQEECRRFNHRRIGTEHVLLGLLAMPESSAGRALRRLGVTQEVARRDVEEIVGRGDRPPSGHVPFTPRAKKVLELSLREALKLNDRYIGSGHILMALVREGQGVAAQVMSRHVPELERVREAVREELRDEPDRSASRLARTPAAEEVLRLAEVLAAGAPVGSHHLLEALARAPRSMASMILQGLGVDAEKIAATVETIEPESTSDVTPELAAARRMRLRVEGDEVHLVLSDPGTVERVRRLTELAGGELTGEEPLTGPFVTLWTSTGQLVAELQRSLGDEAAGDEPESDEPRGRTIRDRLRGRRRPPGHETHG